MSKKDMVFQILVFTLVCRSAFAVEVVSDPVKFKTVSIQRQASVVSLTSLENIEVAIAPETIAAKKDFLEHEIKQLVVAQRQISGGGALLTGIGVLAAPLSMGISLVYVPSGLTMVALGRNADKKSLNALRLIKAAYIQIGLMSPKSENLEKHGDRLAGFIKKYLGARYNDAPLNSVAKAIVMADHVALIPPGSCRQQITDIVFFKEGVSSKVVLDFKAKTKGPSQISG